MIVLIMGENRVGKTTLANKLKEYFGGEVLSFATPLKKIFKDKYKVDFDNCKDTENENNCREKIMKLANKIKRKYGNDYFAKELQKSIKKYNINYFIDDLRFISEYVLIKNANKRKTKVIVISINNYTFSKNVNIDIVYNKDKDNIDEVIAKIEELIK